jgi:hypothetical protein
LGQEENQGLLAQMEPRVILEIVVKKEPRDIVD